MPQARVARDASGRGTAPPHPQKKGRPAKRTGLSDIVDVPAYLMRWPLAST